MKSIVIPDPAISRTEEHPETAISRKHKEAVFSYDQLPVALNAIQVASVLGISRAGAYNLMRSEGFPTLRVGSRMIVPKDKLLAWLNAQIGE